MKEKKDKRRWHGVPLFVIVLIAVGLMAATLFPVVNAVRLRGRFKRFEEAFAEEVRVVEKQGGAKLRADGEEYPLPAEMLSALHYRIILNGMGKERRKAPDAEEVLILFPDGATLSIRPAKITEEARQREKGAYIRFTGADGWTYAFDTDHYEYATVRFWLGLDRS